VIGIINAIAVIGPRPGSIPIIVPEKQPIITIIKFFNDKDPSYRYAAAMAFGSTKDKTALDSLAKLLKDPIQEVRVAAAYAIGQLGEERGATILRSEEHTSELQSLTNLVCRLLLEQKNNKLE